VGTLCETLSGWLQSVARSNVLLWGWSRTGAARRLTFHGRPQNAVNPRLVTPAVGFEPMQYIGVKADGELLLGRGPCLGCLRVERLVERRNVRIVDPGILHAVNSRQVAFGGFSVHVDLPFSWR
jgi:hypothetical protein